MTNRDILKASAKRSKKAAAWVRKAGGMDAVTEDMAARIVKLCRLSDKGGKNHEQMPVRQVDKPSQAHVPCLHVAGSTETSGGGYED